MARLSLAPGMVFVDRFRIVEPLDCPGPGDLFRVELQETKSTLSLRVLEGSLLKDPSAQDRFAEELLAPSNIDCRHIQKDLEAGVEISSNALWYVSELVEGKSLDTHLKERAVLSWPEAAVVLSQLCNALTAAHDAGMAHGQLSPSAVLLAKSPTDDLPFLIKLQDLGLAQVLRSCGDAGQRLAPALWLAPEESCLGPAADVWSLGLLVFRLLTGRHYWLIGNDSSLPAELLSCELRSSELSPASTRAAVYRCSHLLVPGFDAWFSRCVNREPKARFADARAAWKALEHLIVEEGHPREAAASQDPIALEEGDLELLPTHRPPVPHQPPLTPEEKVVVHSAVLRESAQQEEALRRRKALLDAEEGPSPTRMALALLGGLTCALAVTVVILVLGARGKEPVATSPSAIPPTAPAQAPLPVSFDLPAAKKAVRDTADYVSKCGTPEGPTGPGVVEVTFEPTGSAQRVVVASSPFAGTQVGRCIVTAFWDARVPPYLGTPVTMQVPFVVHPRLPPPSLQSSDAGPIIDPGYLTVVCSPFCDQVLANGHDLGPSPVVHIPLSPGHYRVTLRRKGKPSKVVSAIIVSGQVTSNRVTVND